MMFKRFVTLFLMLTLLLGLIAMPTASAATAEEITVLFTHDLHSHLLPSANETGEGEYGGYARLMTAIKAQKAIDPDAILVDGGDFSMGSLFQTAFATSAIELRMMGAMGYDATTLGNHEFDYLRSGLMSMFRAAEASGDRIPTLVCANYRVPSTGEENYDGEFLTNFYKYVKPYTILERGGVYYVLFGIFGTDADDCAPNSEMILDDPAETAQKVVNLAVEECKTQYGADPMVVCLSHSTP